MLQQRCTYFERFSRCWFANQNMKYSCLYSVMCNLISEYYRLHGIFLKAISLCIDAGPDSDRPFLGCLVGCIIFCWLSFFFIFCFWFSVSRQTATEPRKEPCSSLFCDLSLSYISFANKMTKPFAFSSWYGFLFHSFYGRCNVLRLSISNKILQIYSICLAHVSTQPRATNATRFHLLTSVLLFFSF